MGATTSDLKIWIILYKFVPINFFDAKNGPPKQPNPIFCFFAFTHKSNNYCCVFFYVKVVPLRPSSCGWIKIIFFLNLWCLDQKRGAPKATVALGASHNNNYYFCVYMQKNTKTGLVALGAVFTIEKVDRDKLI